MEVKINREIRSYTEAMFFGLSILRRWQQPDLVIILQGSDADAGTLAYLMDSHHCDHLPRGDYSISYYVTSESSHFFKKFSGIQTQNTVSPFTGRHRVFFIY